MGSITDELPKSKREWTLDRAVRWWIVALFAFTSGLILFGFARGSKEYFVLIICCIAAGTFLSAVAGAIALLARQDPSTRCHALLALGAGLLGSSQIVPVFPATLLLGAREVRLAKEDCEPIFRELERWSAEHGEYPADLEALPSRLSIESASHGTPAWFRTRTGQSFYKREEQGYRVFIPDAAGFDANISYESWTGRWNR